MAVYIRTSPPREGVRGGREKFKWESLRTDQDREYYLGASVKIGVRAQGGRFQKNDWWTKQRGVASAQELEEEITSVKNFEDNLMSEALGCKPVPVSQNYKDESVTAKTDGRNKQKNERFDRRTPIAPSHSVIRKQARKHKAAGKKKKKKKREHNVRRE